MHTDKERLTHRQTDTCTHEGSLVSLVGSEVKRGTSLGILAVNVGLVLVEQLLQNSKVTVECLGGRVHGGVCVLCVCVFVYRFTFMPLQYIHSRMHCTYMYMYMYIHAHE